jgi:epoxyqueuosine reductase
VRFSQELREDAFQPREVLSSDARSTARRILELDDTGFQRAFRTSPMKRAKRRGLARNAATVLGNIGTEEDLNALDTALSDPEPLVVEHAAWAIDRIRSRLSKFPDLESD